VTILTDATERSAVHAEVDRRRRRYQEIIVRRLHIRHEGWEAEAGWTNDDRRPYQQLDDKGALRRLDGDITYSVCDVLRYRPPATIPDDELQAHPIAAPALDDSPYHAIARLSLAAADPRRQQELFGWTTPAPGDLAAIEAFEAAKTAYWRKTCVESLKHLLVLKETADFKAVDLLRVLYLAGDIPLRLRVRQPPWRTPEKLGLDVNFSADYQHELERALLNFKFWVDDPFFVDGGFAAGDAGRAQDARKSIGVSDDDAGKEMTFWSENHQILFASAEYLAGQWLPDEVFRAGRLLRAEGADGTRPGDLTGEQRMRHAKPRLLRWLDDRLRLGFSEWNAPGYYQEDFPPLFNLADFCLDDDIRTRAQMVLDLLVFDLARFNHRGSFGVAAGRCYHEHKACGFDQSVGDLMETLFGNRGGIIADGDSISAGSFATSTGYLVPEVLVKIGQDRPVRLVDRSRVSVRFDEGVVYGRDFTTSDDAMFWWSRGAYFTKEMVRCTRQVAGRHHLLGTSPFTDVLPGLETADIALGWATGIAHVLLGPIFLLLGGGNPWEDREGEVTDLLSLLTEGSALTRANIYTYRNRDAMLSSVQNWRAGQFNLQSQPCMATLSQGATVWTGHPSSGAYLNIHAEAQAGGGILGTIIGSTLGAITFGPLGAIAGGIYGGVKGAEAGGDATKKPIELYKRDIHDGPNWWTGSVTLPRVVQRDGAAILAYQPHDIPAMLFGASTHAWFPMAAFDAGSVHQHAPRNCNVDHARWTFGKVGDGYVGLFSARPVEWTTSGPWDHKELIAEAGRNVFIIQIGNRDEFGSYDEFVRRVSGARIHVNGLRYSGSDFECSYDVPGPGGQRLELHYDEDKVRWAGRQFSDDGFPRFETPYVKCGRVRWGQYHYTIAFGGHALTHDFRQLRTKVDDARVTRSVDGVEYDCEEDRVWVVAAGGAPRILPENTIESCRHAVNVQGAMALAVDACLTADGQVALWRDWMPSPLPGWFASGAAGRAYRPVGPDPGDPLFRPVVELTLAQLRSAYGYEPGPAVVIPTLAELVREARTWTGLRHLVVDIRLPAEEAGTWGTQLAASVAAAVSPGASFDVVLMVDDAGVLRVLREAMSQLRPALPMTFAWRRSMPPESSVEPPPGSLAAPAPISPDDQSAVAGALEHHCEVAVLQSRGRGGLMFVAAHDVAHRERFNLNPRENKGQQLTGLLVAGVDDAADLELLVELGVSGFITDDVPALLGVLAKTGIA
jgi:glycerophosphoryl diester phosphodiesterase